MKLLLVVFVTFFARELFAQESECTLPDNKKATKLYDEAKKEKAPSVRRDLLKQAIEAEPDHYAAIYDFAYENIRLAEKSMRGDIKFAAKKLEEVIRLCPSYHPYPYYYLGMIALGEKKYDESLRYFKQFTDFRYTDDRLYPKDYEQKNSEVQRATKTAEFYSTVYKNKVPFEPKAVEGISTSADEYLAIISPDNELCFFTRKQQKISKNSLAGSIPTVVEEFTLAEAKDGEHFNAGEALPPPFNLTDNIGGASVTVDNQHIYVTICKQTSIQDEATKQFSPYYNCDIYQSDYDNVKGNWSEPKNLGEGVNGKNSFEGQASISSDGNALFFVSIRKDDIGSINDMDLYMSVKSPTGLWGKAVNLGTTINTHGNEKSPFMHSDSQTLYFSSDSLPGVGGFDIFYTRMGNDGKWSSPKNIGYPINSENDDISFFVSTDGRTAYFSTNVLKQKGGWDLYSFPLYKEARPEKVLFLKGEIKNDSGMVVKDAKIELKNVRTKEITQIAVDTISGKYAAVVNLKDDVILTVKKEGAAFNSRYFPKTDTATAGKPQQVNVTVAPIKTGAAYRINDINFETNSWDLNDASMNILTEFGAFLRENPTLKVAIHGHTDNVGNDAANLSLSENRAKAVYAFLRTLSIDQNVLSFKGFGKTKPLTSNATEEGRAQNRRTEFVITGQ